ncbi:MAG: NAD(+) diphosphatase [Gammaproteobacteria bacterium]|nr:NAD(+) diphosphatase [Gammaproteobacteria bacterium]MCP5417235.1 NAD(+) diphosphatase [Chromatiaceae bacterium]
MQRNSQRYSGCVLDRASRLRKDPVWLAQRFAEPDTRILPVWRNRNLIVPAASGSAVPVLMSVARCQSQPLLAVADESVFLGIESGRAVFAVDISSLSQVESGELAGSANFLDLRRVGGAMAADQAALAAYARGALRWHRYSRFCGHCGALSESRHGGHLRVCSNSDCAREIYPRTDPAVIMLVEEYPTSGAPPRCLLAHHHRSPPGAYSTLAGFVEPGESLEEAVAREVFEEVGIHLRSVHYQDSQPWPFPGSIMLGFRAVAETSEITIDRSEIGDARWFTLAQVLEFGEWGDPAAERRISPKDSIARYLIDSWLSEVSGQR